jgi:hypothetical protein
VVSEATTSSWPHFPHGILLTIAFEEPVKRGLLASPTEFLSLVHQSFLYCIMSTQHYDWPMSQVDGEHRSIALAHLMEWKEQ